MDRANPQDPGPGRGDLRLYLRHQRPCRSGHSRSTRSSCIRPWQAC